MMDYPVHSCTDVTGFSLLGHSLEMAQGSGVRIHLQSDRIQYHPEALEMASMGLVPAGAYRNREFAELHLQKQKEIPRALEDILFDPQTSGGLLIALPEKEGEDLYARLSGEMEGISLAGYVTEGEGIVIE